MINWRLGLATVLLAWGALVVDAHAQTCLGDCDMDEHVTINELIVGVGTALGSAPIERCAAFDGDGNGTVAIDELVSGVGNALDRCPSLRTTDPGSGPWREVAEDEVAAECGLDPDLLRAADAIINKPWAVVRYGKLCHQYFPSGADSVTHVFSASKTLGAVVTGVAAYETRGMIEDGPGTGPLSDEDPVAHWLDEFSFNPEARVAHVLAMVGHSPSLAYGDKFYIYDAIGVVQINRLSDIVNNAIVQDADRLGANLDEFTQEYLFDRLGMNASVWNNHLPNKFFAYSWNTTIGDMARLGLLIMNDGAWNGARVLDREWIYRLTHPAFEDANTGYGYLTWLNSASNFTYGLEPDENRQGPDDPCAPVAIYKEHPHGLSAAPDCNYEPEYSCEQEFDVGVWYAAGLGGQYILGHRGLDMVLVGKDLGDGNFALIWNAMRPALLAYDPNYAGDEEAFCTAYGANHYAPDLR